MGARALCQLGGAATDRELCSPGGSCPGLEAPPPSSALATIARHEMGFEQQRRMQLLLFTGRHGG